MPNDSRKCFNDTRKHELIDKVSHAYLGAQKQFPQFADKVSCLFANEPGKGYSKLLRAKVVLP